MASYDDFWKARDVRPHLKNIRPAVMTVGGWFDAEDLFGTLETYKHVEANSPRRAEHAGDGALEPRRLVPRRRAVAGADLVQRQDGGLLPRERSSCPSSSSTSRARGRSEHPKAWVFQTGVNRWRQFTAWPPREARPKAIFLRAGGRLAFDPPADAEPAAVL